MAEKFIFSIEGGDEGGDEGRLPPLNEMTPSQRGQFYLQEAKEQARREREDREEQRRQSRKEEERASREATEAKKDEDRKLKNQRAQERLEIFKANKQDIIDRRAKREQDIADAKEQRQHAKAIRDARRDEISAFQYRKDFINDLLGAAGRSRLGYRINRGLDLLNTLGVIGVRAEEDPQTPVVPTAEVVKSSMTSVSDAVKSVFASKEVEKQKQTESESNSIRETIKTLYEASGRQQSPPVFGPPPPPVYGPPPPPGMPPRPPVFGPPPPPSGNQPRQRDFSAQAIRLAGGFGDSAGQGNFDKAKEYAAAATQRVVEVARSQGLLQAGRTTIGALGAASKAAGATGTIGGAALGVALNPVTLAVVGGLTAVAGTAYVLYKTFSILDRGAQKLAESLANVPGAVMMENIRQELINFEFNMQRSRDIGPQMSDYQRASGELNRALTSLGDTVFVPLVELVADGKESLTRIVSILDGFFQIIQTAQSASGGVLNPFEFFEMLYNPLKKLQEYAGWWWSKEKEKEATESMAQAMAIGNILNIPQVMGNPTAKVDFNVSGI